MQQSNCAHSRTAATIELERKLVGRGGKKKGLKSLV
jgi:hypothetical protein